MVDKLTIYGKLNDLTDWQGSGILSRKKSRQPHQLRNIFTLRSQPISQGAMAQSLRRPFLGTVGLSSNFLRSSIPIQRRCATSKRPMQGQRPASQSEPSFRISQKQGQAMPSDMGMLPGTCYFPSLGQAKRKRER